MLINLDQKRIDASRRLLEHVAEHLEADLSVRLWNGEIVPLKTGARSDILLCINSAGALRRLIFAPKLMTVAELYASGDIDIEGGTPIEAARRWDHLRALRLARNLDKPMILKSVWPFLAGSGSAGKAHSASFDRSIEGQLERGRDDKELIQFHYDVSNAFYALFLDPEMVYSSAYFARPEMSLEEAQRAKLDMICRRLRLEPGDRLLDIGCGWGGLICHAAQNYGVTAYGVT